MSGDNNTSNAVKKCSVWEQMVFLIALLCGTACSICSKTMMGLHGEGVTGEIEKFQKPIFQTFGMFIGMCAGLIMHVFVVVFKIPFPGYEHERPLPKTEPPTPMTPRIFNHKAIAPENNTDGVDEEDPLLGRGSAQFTLSYNGSETKVLERSTPSTTPVWMYFLLAVPSVFDLGATAFCMMGLVYLDVSIYQLLRGSAIIFVALMKHHALGDHLFKFQWIGVFWNVVSVVLVGATAMLNSGGEEKSGTMAEALLGVTLVLAGAFVQALQYVFEEKVMNVDDIPVPPLLLIGMEGLWGTILCLGVVYPLAYFLPGNDHGSYEDPFNTWHMLINTPTIQWSFVIYFFAILGYNIFAVLVTFLLNSVWHAILDNFRPITVWATDMFIYYCIVAGGIGGFGEPWTPYSFIQLFGMFVLLYGTAIYNAPNAGSVELRGKWYHLFMNMSNEYECIDLDESFVSFKSATFGSAHSITRAL